MVYVLLTSVIGGFIGAYIGSKHEPNGYLRGMETMTGFFIGAFCGTCAASLWNVTWSMVGYHPTLSLTML